MHSLAGQIKAGNGAVRCDSVLADEADESRGSAESVVPAIGGSDHGRRCGRRPQPGPAQTKDLET
jgi:hypothetical protein